MGRVREMIKVDGRECWTLFDTGVRNTYVIPDVASALTTTETLRPIRTALGGSVKETTRTALLEAEVEGHPISTHAMVVASKSCSGLWRCSNGVSARSRTRRGST